MIIGNPRAEQQPEPEVVAEEPEVDIEEPELEPLNLGVLDYKGQGISMKFAQRTAEAKLKQYPPEQRDKEWESELYAAYIEVFRLDDFIPSSLRGFVHNTLLKIYLEEKPEHAAAGLETRILLLEYSRLRLQFRNKTEAQSFGAIS